MITFTRIGVIAPGKAAAVAAFNQKVVDFYRTQYDVKVEVQRPVAGNPSRIAWVVRYPALAALEAVLAKSQADPKYLELIATATDLFIAGTTHDEIWRSA
nr:hypothetical protein [Caldimonas sp.]